jgi:hypothetical protein
MCVMRAVLAEVRMTSDAQTLCALSQAVRRLRPDHRDPESYHLEKDQIARALIALARKLETDA